MKCLHLKIFTTLVFGLMLFGFADEQPIFKDRLYATGNVGFLFADGIDANESGQVRGKILLNLPSAALEMRLVGGWTVGARAGLDVLVRIEGSGELSSAIFSVVPFHFGFFTRYYAPLATREHEKNSSLFLGATFQKYSGESALYGFELGQRRTYWSGLLFDYHLLAGVLKEDAKPDNIFVSLQVSIGCVLF